MPVNNQKAKAIEERVSNLTEKIIKSFGKEKLDVSFFALITVLSRQITHASITLGIGPAMTVINFARDELNKLENRLRVVDNIKKDLDSK